MDGASFGRRAVIASFITPQRKVRSPLQVIPQKKYQWVLSGIS